MCDKKRLKLRRSSFTITDVTFFNTSTHSQSASSKIMVQGLNSSNSPVGSPYGNGHNNAPYYSYNATSPNNSDGNHYQSPLVSPGEWNASPPYYNYAMNSSQSNATFQRSPSSTTSAENRSSPPSSPLSSFQPPALPSDLGNQRQQRNSAKSYAVTQESINRRFVENNGMDHEREKIANRRVQPMMVEVSRKRTDSSAFGKNEAKAFLTSNGTKAFAPNSRKKVEPMIMEDLKGSVDDFKSGQHGGRERAARFHAMRIITKLDNAA